MEIDTQYAVKTFFPTSAFPQVYLEAVANAFDAGADSINIEVFTDGEISPTILDLVISDNGIGFTNERFEAFRRIQAPADAFHKGLGRLVYLQYFQTIAVESAFDGQIRRFAFHDDFDGEEHLEASADLDAQSTTLRFSGFRKDRLRSFDDLKPALIKAEILDHFLPLLHGKKKRGDDFRVKISLQTDRDRKQYGFFSDVATISPEDVPEFATTSIEEPELGAFSTVEMSYFVREEGGEGGLVAAVSVDGRALPLNLLRGQPLPVGYSATFLFESDLFQGRSDSARQRLILPEEVPESVVFPILRHHIGAVLVEQVPSIDERNRSTRRHFEDRFPHLTGLFDKNTVGLIDRDQAVEAAQDRFFAKSRAVLGATSMDNDTFRESLELSSRSLAEYVLYRDLIIKRLEAISEDDSEEKIHDLIAPRFETFEDNRLVEEIYGNNAWLLDDRFMTFRTMLSEARMDEVVAAIAIDEEAIGGRGRPDISLIFSADPEKAEAVEVVMVEVKRRQVNDKEGPYAATQLVKRAQKLIEHCGNIERMWYFGILEMDDDLVTLLKNMNWTPFYSKGDLLYQEFPVNGVPVPTYLLSWNAVVEDAAARNHTFLELLRSALSGEGSDGD